MDSNRKKKRKLASDVKNKKPVQMTHLADNQPSTSSSTVALDLDLEQKTGGAASVQEMGEIDVKQAGGLGAASATVPETTVLTTKTLNFGGADSDDEKIQIPCFEETVASEGPSTGVDEGCFSDEQPDVSQASELSQNVDEGQGSCHENSDVEAAAGAEAAGEGEDGEFEDAVEGQRSEDVGGSGIDKNDEKMDSEDIAAQKAKKSSSTVPQEALLLEKELRNQSTSEFTSEIEDTKPSKKLSTTSGKTVKIEAVAERLELAEKTPKNQDIHVQFEPETRKTTENPSGAETAGFGAQESASNFTFIDENVDKLPKIEEMPSEHEYSEGFDSFSNALKLDTDPTAKTDKKHPQNPEILAVEVEEGPISLKKHSIQEPPPPVIEAAPTVTPTEAPHEESLASSSKLPPELPQATNIPTAASPPDYRRASTPSTVSLEKQSVTLDLNSEMDVSSNSSSDAESDDYFPEICENLDSRLSASPTTTASPAAPMSSPVPVLPESPRSISPPAKTAPPIPPPTYRNKRSISGQSTGASMSLPRLYQQLSISPLQFKPCAGLLVNPESRVSIQVKLDDDEVLETIPVNGNSVRIFSETATVEMQKNSQHVKLVFVEHMANSETRQIGKVTVRKRDIIPVSGTDVNLPVQGSASSRSMISAILGEICLDIKQDQEDQNVVKLRVLDYTTTVPLPLRRSSNSSTSSSSSNTSGQYHLASCNGKAFLAVCVTAYGEPLGPMSKIHLLDRRAVQSVDLSRDSCREKYVDARARFVNSPKDDNGNNKNTEASAVRLNIKIYSDSSYDESSYVGFVRIPLDSETFMPVENTVGTNWYEIKSRMTIATNTTVLQQPTSPNAVSQYDSLDNMPSTSTSTSITTTTTTTTNTTYPPNMATERVGDLKIRFWYSVEHILSFQHYQPLYQALLSSINSANSSNFDTSTASLFTHLTSDIGSVARPLMKVFLNDNNFDQFFRLVCRQYMKQGREPSTLFRNQSLASKLMHEVMKFLGNDYLVQTLKPVIDLVYAEKKKCEIDPSKLKPGEVLEENIRNLAVYAELAFIRVCESASSCPDSLQSIFAVLRGVVDEHYKGSVEISRLAVSSFLIMRFFSAAILNPTQYGLKRRAPDADVTRTLVLISKILQRLANCVVSTHPLTTKEPWLNRVLERFLADSDHKTLMVEFFDAVSIPHYRHPHQNPASTPSSSEVLKSGLMVERRGGSSRRRSIKDFISQKKRFVTLTDKELSWQKVKDKDSQNDVEQKGVISLSDITSVTQITDSKTSFKVSTPHQEVNFQANNNGDMTDWMILLITNQRKNLFFHNRVPSPSTSSSHIDVEKELETLHTILIQNFDKLVEWEAAASENEAENCPTDKFPAVLLQKIKSPEERQSIRHSLKQTLSTTIEAVRTIEDVHQTAVTLAIQMQNLQNCKSDKLGISGLTDNENYLLMHGRERHLKAKGIQSKSLKQ